MLKSILEHREKEREQEKVPLKDVPVLGDCEQIGQSKFKKYYLGLRQYCYRYQEIENAHNNVYNL